MKVEMFHRVGLALTVEQRGEESQDRVSFILGVHPVLPGLAEHIRGLGVGESASFTIAPSSEGQDQGEEPILVTATVESVEPVSQREIIRTLAESTECACTCGCTGHSHE